VIEYDYEIERNEGDKMGRYIPNRKIGKKLPNLVLIEAPNSSGKSTLLNILAVGFFGLKNKENIVASLVDDMKNLILSEHQNIWFKLKIESGDGTFLLSEKNKNNENPIVYKLENGSLTPIAPETFNREYRLIYDIPDKPRERLKEILNDVESLQVNIGNDVAEFKKYIEKLLEEINKSKNPEQIKKLSERIRKYNEIIEETKAKIKGCEHLIAELEMYMAVKFFVEYYLSYVYTEAEIKEIKKAMKKIKKQQTKYNEYMREFNMLIDRLIRLKTEIIKYIQDYGYPTLTEKAEKLEVFMDKQTLLDINAKDYNNMLIINDQMVFDIYREVKEIKEERENLLDRQLKELEIINKLIAILNSYKSYDIEVPGTNKMIDQYLDELNREYAKKKILLDEYKLLESLLDKLNEIMDLLEKDIPECVKKLKKNMPSDGNVAVVQEPEIDRLDELNKKLELLNKKLDEYSIKCDNYGFSTYEDIRKKKEELERKESLMKYTNLDENMLREEIKKWENKLEKYKIDLGKYMALRDKEDAELTRLKNLPEHKYYTFKKEIKMLGNICNKVEKKFKNTFYNYLKYLRSPESFHLDLDEKFDNYRNSIGKYLGKKIGEIKYVDGIYRIEKIDLLEDTIYTAEGKVIKLSDLGTGHMQAAYIQSILNRDDPRKIIALFDEISHMDRKTLRPILNKIRELYRAGKLIACVMVQKGEDVKVIDLEQEGF